MATPAALDQLIASRQFEQAIAICENIELEVQNFFNYLEFRILKFVNSHRLLQILSLLSGLLMTFSWLAI